MYGITRIDNDKARTHSWVVTISRKGKKHFKSFSDARHGNKNKALAAAKEYRDEILSRYSPQTLKEYCSIVKRNNRSGISGVSRYAQKEPDNDGNLRWYWVASWSPEPGKTKKVKFSVKKYGEEEAFRKAVQAREQALEERKGYFDPGKKVIEGTDGVDPSRHILCSDKICIGVVDQKGFCKVCGKPYKPASQTADNNGIPRLKQRSIKDRNRRTPSPKALKYPLKGKKEKTDYRIESDDEGFDPSKRILCSDGTCIGVVNQKGFCKVCGKPYIG